VEVDYIFDLEDATLEGMIVFSKKVAKAIEKVVSCKRIGLTVIGFEVPHAHIHLVPMKRMKDLDFAKKKVQLNRQEFTDLAATIAAQVVL